MEKIWKYVSTSAICIFLLFGWFTAIGISEPEPTMINSERLEAHVRLPFSDIHVTPTVMLIMCVVGGILLGITIVRLRSEDSQ